MTSLQLLPRIITLHNSCQSKTRGCFFRSENMVLHHVVLVLFAFCSCFVFVFVFSFCFCFLLFCIFQSFVVSHQIEYDCVFCVVFRFEFLFVCLLCFVLIFHFLVCLRSVSSLPNIDNVPGLSILDGSFYVF